MIVHAIRRDGALVAESFMSTQGFSQGFSEQEGWSLKKFGRGSSEGALDEPGATAVRHPEVPGVTTLKVGKGVTPTPSNCSPLRCCSYW